jgi:hypothetical protein
MENDRNAPSTKGDIEDVRAEMTAMERRVIGGLTETMREIRTEMLKAFYAFAESNLKRLAEIETEGEALKSRLATLEERLLQVERRVNFPNHPLQ